MASQEAGAKPKPSPPPSLPEGVQNGRHPDPQGGRIHNVQGKVSVFEAEALAAEKKRMEAVLGRGMSDSEFVRLRLLNGGEPLTVDYPEYPADTRREVRGSVPRSPDKA